MGEVNIAALLAAARDAHARFQAAQGRIDTHGRLVAPTDDVASEGAVRDALAAREMALEADPAQSDPAWAADQQANRGVSSSALVDFYRHYLS